MDNRNPETMTDEKLPEGAEIRDLNDLPFDKPGQQQVKPKRNYLTSMLAVAGWVAAIVIGYQLYNYTHAPKMTQLMRVFGF
jgi:hypothetical protein